MPKNISQIYLCLNNNGPNMEPCGTQSVIKITIHVSFFVSIFKGKIVKRIENLYLLHILLLFQLIIHDQYYQKPCRSL